MAARKKSTSQKKTSRTPAKKPAGKAGKSAAKENADDLFAGLKGSGGKSGYSAKDIEVLEGLEPVRRRPGMYIGGTDEAALHHLAAEVLDNAMDEAVAGHASRIEMTLESNGALTISDNGRGIPVDPHPKFKSKSALEVIMTTLHSGGKFSNKAYATSGGLHGVGISVVNALSDKLVVHVARDRKAWEQNYSRGKATTKLKALGAANNKRGTTISFTPDPKIFGDKAAFRARRLYAMARSKAYLFSGVEIRWSCDRKLAEEDGIAEKDSFHFPGGLMDFLELEMTGSEAITPTPFSGSADLPEGRGRVEWALAWRDGEGFTHAYCNTIPTPEGGTHVAGLRAALSKGIRAYGELTGNRKASSITADDILSGTCAILSVFIPDPQFQGQTKDKLSTVSTQRDVETTLKDHFEHWLTASPDMAGELLAWCIMRAEDRLRRKQDKEITRKSATRKLRLPGKLTDCSQDGAAGSELFIVEGDSAGGSAKQARDRKTQAVLPIRGKILNVASAARDKISANQELKDLIQALGCGMGDNYREKDLRYEKIIIMCDADVDGAHIASLLMTFFFRSVPQLIQDGHLFLAQPPLYRLTYKAQSEYALDEAHREKLMKTTFKGKDKVDVSRFKGLGEMPPAQLRATTMDPNTRTLLRVSIPDKPSQALKTSDLVEQLMGRRPELRFAYIQKHAADVVDVDV